MPTALVEAPVVGRVREGQLAPGAGKASHPRHRHRIDIEVERENVVQSMSAENTSVQLRVPDTAPIEPVNVSLPWPISLLGLAVDKHALKSATAKPVRSPLYSLTNPLVSQNET